jgi:hypothetical protein
MFRWFGEPFDIIFSAVDLTQKTLQDRAYPAIIAQAPL